MSKISQFFENLKKNFIATSLIYMVLGVILLIFPAQVANVACYVLGALLIAGGVVLIIKFFSCRGVSSLFSATLICGIIFAAVGIFIIVRSDIVLSIVPFIFGIIAIFDGIIGIQRSILLSRTGFGVWWLSLLFSIVAILLGVVMAVNPFESTVFIFRFIGICLVFDGIVDLWGVNSLSKAVNDAKDADYVIEEPDTKDSENK